MAQHQGPRRRRSPHDIVILTGAAVIWGEAQAEAKLEQVASLWPIDVAMANMGIDFRGHDLDDPFPEDQASVF